MSSPRIMVVDDDEDTLDLMQEILSSDGYEVVCTQGVSASLEEIIETSPDLLVVDLLLSTEQQPLSGWDVVRLVKSHRELRNLEVLVVSADYPSIRSHVDDVARMNGVRMLTKPFTLDSLSVMVHDALRGRPATGHHTPNGALSGFEGPIPDPGAES